MYCINCGKQLPNDSLFCSFCANNLQVTTEKLTEGSVDKYFKNKENSCQICGYSGVIKYTDIYQNIGMLVMRQHKSVKGKLCKECISKTFWNYTSITLFLSWWGTISFLVTPLILINNVGRCIFSLGVKD